jgi:hypothetical protein
MDRLASCYFCGVAVEAPLEEYPVVPRDLRPGVEDQSTVVLCPECRRKLSTIVDRVVDAATDPGVANGPDTAQETLSSEDESAADQSGIDESVLGGFDHKSPDLVDVGDDRTEGTPQSRDQGEEASNEHATDDDQPATQDDREPDSEWNDTEPTDDRQETAEETGSDDDSAESDTAPTADRDFSRSSYNRVVKLLQNREFPVDADDIQTVARSAYEINRRESQAIIDALIDRGVIERDGDRLVRPDED